MKKVTIMEGLIRIEGFNDVEFSEPGKSGLNKGSCRDVVNAGMFWALQKLVNDLEKDMLGDWDNQISVVD